MAPLFFSRLKHNSIEIRDINGYKVFIIKEDLALGADFGVLSEMIDREIQKAHINIAIQFTPRSYLYTPTIARLVEYYQILKDKGGKLCLVQLNNEIIQALDTIGFSKLVRIVPSLQDI